LSTSTGRRIKAKRGQRSKQSLSAWEENVTPFYRRGNWDPLRPISHTHRDWLRNNNYLIGRKGVSHNMPTQVSMDMQLFEINETVISHSDGHTTIVKTPKITGKGQQYFIHKFLKEA